MKSSGVPTKPCDICGFDLGTQTHQLDNDRGNPDLYYLIVLCQFHNNMRIQMTQEEFGIYCSNTRHNLSSQEATRRQSEEFYRNLTLSHPASDSSM